MYLYSTVYGKDLKRDITQDVSGGLEDMLVQILKCERDQSETVNVDEAKEDARQLYKVCIFLSIISAHTMYFVCYSLKPLVVVCIFVEFKGTPTAGVILQLFTVKEDPRRAPV